MMAPRASSNGMQFRPSMRLNRAMESRISDLQVGDKSVEDSAAEEDWELVADELAAAAREDRRSAGETCALLLAFAGRRTSESEAVRQHAENDRGVAAAGRLANQDRKANERSETIQRGSVNGEADWGGHQHSGSAERPKQSALPPQRGQRDLRLTRRGRRARLSGKGEAQNGNSGQNACWYMERKRKGRAEGVHAGRLGN